MVSRKCQVLVMAERNKKAYLNPEGVRYHDPYIQRASQFCDSASESIRGSRKQSLLDLNFLVHII